MTTMFKKFAVAAALAASIVAFSPVASAADVKMVGTITEIKLAPDGKSATATLKNVKGGAEVTVTIKDDLTLDKFKDKRIVKGDEVRVKYDDAQGNLSKSFLKTAGCS
jgi:P pilus assembly chaperone PapD